MNVEKEIFYIANIIGQLREEWMLGKLSDALFSDRVGIQIEALRNLREKILKSGKEKK